MVGVIYEAGERSALDRQTDRLDGGGRVCLLSARV